MDNNVRPILTRALAWLALVAFASIPAWIPQLAQAAQTKTVTMVGQGFNPEDVYIRAGDSVKWKNNDPITHNVKFENGSMDQNVSPGEESSTKTFPSSSGSPYRYYCNIHGDTGGRGMSGRVIINSTGSPPSTPNPPVTTITQSPSGSPKPKPTKKATATSSPTASATPTVSPTPSPTPTTPTPSPTDTLPSSSPLPTFAGGDTGSSDGSNNLGAVLAIVVVAVLGGAGYLVYRRFIAAP